jgi:hypothetical protein
MIACRITIRPIRPNPLMPTLIDIDAIIWIGELSCGEVIYGGWRRRWRIEKVGAGDVKAGFYGLCVVGNLRS